MAGFGVAETANLIVKMTLGGNYQSQLAKATRATQKFDKDATRAFKAGGQIGTGIKNLGRLAVVAGAGITGLAVATAKAAGDFEAQLNTINTVARQTPAELGKIGDAIRKIARDTGTTTDDLTQGYYDLVSAGIKAADATNVLTAANTLAIGGLATTAETVDLLTTAINTYGGDAKKAGQYTDIFAKAIERGKVTASELAQSFAIVGPVAANSGIEIQELAAGYARLTAAGIPAAEAATDMRSAIIGLTRTTKPLEKLQAATGKNYLKIAGKKGLVEALQQLRTDGEKAGIPMIELLGRVEGLNFLLSTTGPNFAAYNADLAAMGTAAGTASAQMAERQKGLNFQLARLKALSKDAGISIGSALLPKLTPLLQRLNEFVGGAEGQKTIADIGSGLAGLFTDSNITAGINALKSGFQIAKDAAPAIAGAAKITGAALKVAVDAFNALPKEIQSIAIAGLAVNKLTGGLVTNVFGGIAEAIAKSFIKAPLVNVQGGVVNVAGGGLPGVGGGKPGIGPGAALGVIGLVATTAVITADTLQSAANNNATLKSQGLTSAEISAQKYFNAAKSDQQTIIKRLGYMPTKADFESGNAKLQKAVIKNSSGSPDSRDEQRKIADVKAQAQRTAAAVKDADSTISAKVAADTAAVRAVAPPIVSAIYAARPIITTNVSISATTITKVNTTVNRYGSALGSRSQDSVNERNK